MKTFNHILSQNEKQIFENHFINESRDSKIDFINCASQIINQYSENKVNLEEKWKNKSNNDYEINIIWDEKNSITAAHYFLANPQFKLSKVKIKHLKIFNRNLNQINNQGETPIMLLAKHYDSETELVDLVENPLGFDLHTRDNQNKNFYIHFFENYPHQFEGRNKKNYKIVKFMININNFDKIINHWVHKFGEQETEEKNLLVISQGLLKASAIITKIATANNYLKSQRLRTNIENIGHMLELKATMNVNKIDKKIIKI